MPLKMILDGTSFGSLLINTGNKASALAGNSKARDQLRHGGVNGEIILK